MFSVSDIPALHDQLTLRWHVEALETWHTQSESPDPGAAWTSLVSRQHLANFELWHTEDAARTPGATDADLARVKRRIDDTNQRRNDLSEQMDLTLLASLEAQNLPNPASPLHSESPGLMIDRLSILSLKIFHTREEMERAGAPPGHAVRNGERLGILTEQRNKPSESAKTKR